METMSLISIDLYITADMYLCCVRTTQPVPTCARDAVQRKAPLSGYSATLLARLAGTRMSAFKEVRA